MLPFGGAGVNPFQRHKIDHLSPSSLNTYAEQPSYWALKYLHGYSDDGSPAMWRGSAVEAGLNAFLYKGDRDGALLASLSRFELDAMGVIDPETDRERARLPTMLDLAMRATEGFGEPTVTQLKVEYWFDGIEIPIIGFIDYEWPHEGIDLKTTAGGIRTQIPGGHARQVSLYQVARQKPYRILYITPSKAEFKALSADEVQTNIKRLEWHAHAIRRVLSMFSDPHDLARIFVPDFDHFYWKREEARRLAADIWNEIPDQKTSQGALLL